MFKYLMAAAGALAFALVSLSAGAADAPKTDAAKSATAKTETAIFAAGCFWCVESDFDKVDGVLETISGYTGGKTENPTYHDVGGGDTGHAEALKVTYDPSKVTYQKLLDYYWRHVDLVDGGGQFCDRGSQYRPAIFTNSDEQKTLAEASKTALDASGKFKQKIAVQIVPAATFTAAEDYHQDYYHKNPIRYKFYRSGCGRDSRLEQLWGAEYTH
jgi:methionine-S-sulfoxide reductase